jgi:tetratricopeptide (TPR) repeat protein
MISTLIDLLGNFYARNDFTNFEAIARSLLATIPGDQVSLQFLGLVYYRTGRIQDAIKVFDKVVRRRKSAATPRAEPKKGNAGDADPSLGDSAAVVCYREATRNSPHLGQAWYDLGTVLLEVGKHEQAIAAFRSALITQPALTSAMLAMGQAGLHVDDIVAAEDGFSRLRALQPNNADAYQGLAKVYRKRRDFATARACVARVRVLRRGIDNLKRAP